MSQPTTRLRSDDQPRSSAGTLAIGLSVLVLGALVTALGLGIGLTPVTLIGGVLTLAGSVVQILGIIRLASNVDVVAAVQRAQLD